MNQLSSIPNALICFWSFDVTFYMSTGKSAVKFSLLLTLRKCLVFLIFSVYFAVIFWHVTEIVMLILLEMQQYLLLITSLCNVYGTAD